MLLSCLGIWRSVVWDPSRPGGG